MDLQDSLCEWYQQVYLVCVHVALLEQSVVNQYFQVKIKHNYQYILHKLLIVLERTKTLGKKCLMVYLSKPRK